MSRPCLTRADFSRWGVISPAQPAGWITAPCWLSETAYSTHYELSISGCLLRLQHLRMRDSPSKLTEYSLCGIQSWSGRHGEVQIDSSWDIHIVADYQSEWVIPARKFGSNIFFSCQEWPLYIQGLRNLYTAICRNEAYSPSQQEEFMKWRTYFVFWLPF